MPSPSTTILFEKLIAITSSSYLEALIAIASSSTALPWPVSYGGLSIAIILTIVLLKKGRKGT